jgi:hypothetical protein
MASSPPHGALALDAPAVTDEAVDVDDGPQATASAAAPKTPTDRVEIMTG